MQYNQETKGIHDLDYIKQLSDQLVNFNSAFMEI